MFRFAKLVNMVVRKSSTSAPEPNVSQLDSWLKIHRELRKETQDIVNTAIDSRNAHVNADIEAIKGQLGGLKAEMRTLKEDMGGIRKDITDINRNVVELHKQGTNNTRLILGGLFGIATAAVGVNQYLEQHNESQHNGKSPQH